jgi:hypothetical protein
MSFIDKNNSEYLTARITKKGRKAIANGDFTIKYFTIGDSEFVYSSAFSGLTSNVVLNTTHQGVLSPFDKDEHIKYPIKYNNDSIIYGIPITGATTETIRNVMGSAGFVSEHITYTNTTGTTIQCISNEIDFDNITGTSQLTVNKLSGTTYLNCEYITLALNSFQNISGNTIVSGYTNNLVYKIISVSGSTSGTTQTIVLDRNTPNLTGITGTGNVICNKCEMEFDMTLDTDVYIPIQPDNIEQHNPWKLNVIWSTKPIGADVQGNDESLSGYTSSKYISTKEYLGYLSTGQTFIDVNGTPITGISYYNTYDEQIVVVPNEQKCIAIIHYSEVGDIIYDADRFFRYDDYISNSTDSLVDDSSGDPITDKDYFEVNLPFINYHRNGTTAIGTVLKMGDTDYYIKSTLNEYSKIKFRFLIDENGYNVGKVFLDKKIVVIDDEEIVAALDYRTNRKYTLPAPKIKLIPSVDNTYLLNNTGQTMWVTYAFGYTNDNRINALPCNYHTKILGTTTPSNIGVNFSYEFGNLSTNNADIKNKIIANKFYILIQETITGDLPTHNGWEYIDYTTEAGGSSLSSLTGTTFVINETKNNTALAFDLEDHMSGLTVNYLGTESAFDVSTLTPQFGDEQPFPGSVRLVRASDIEEMNFLINLPNGVYTTSQNPSKLNNTTMNTMITEVALHNENKDVMVVAKSSKPIPRTGAQDF